MPPLPTIDVDTDVNDVDIDVDVNTSPLLSTAVFVVVDFGGFSVTNFGGFSFTDFSGLSDATFLDFSGFSAEFGIFSVDVGFVVVDEASIKNVDWTVVVDGGVLFSTLFGVVRTISC